jgi:hypothetical protein
MKVDLYQRSPDEWQADVILPDGMDCHAVGLSPGRALIELGHFLEGLRQPNDIETLFRTMVETR